MNWIRLITLTAVFLVVLPLYADEAGDQFNNVKKSFDAKQYESARAGFEAFIAKYPNNAQTREATFYLAESLLYLQRYAQSESYFNRLTATGSVDLYSRAAQFRIAEIPYMQGQFDIAKPRLSDFVDKYSQDANLQFVLYYLGDIAMRSDAEDSALEAEFYFDQAERMFPDGAKSLECKLGTAWAKNKLGKQTEAEGIYQQLMNSTNLSIVEQATYQYGLALFERSAFQDAITKLTDFQRRFPASTFYADSQRVIIRCKVRLNDHEGALQTLTQIVQPSPDDLLLKVRCLYNLKRTQEAKTALDAAKRSAGTAYRDEIALLESVFLSEQKNWQGTITLLEQILVPQYDPVNNRMVVNYFSFPNTSGTKKLNDGAVFRACSLLTLAYAQTNETAKANALLNEMNAQATLLNKEFLISICSDTSLQLAGLGTNSSRPGNRPNGSGGRYNDRNNDRWGDRNNQFGNNQYTDRNNNDRNNGRYDDRWNNNYSGGRNQNNNQNNAQWSPPSNGTGSGLGSLSPIDNGTDLQRFWRAERLYQIRNYADAALLLEQVLSGYYNQIVSPPQYTVFYNVTDAEGTLNEATFAKACSLLALSKAQSGELDQAGAVLAAFAPKIRMNDPIQQKLLQETIDQLAALTKSVNPPLPGTSREPGTASPDSSQRRLLREANTYFRLKRYDQTDTRCTELLTLKLEDYLLTEVLLLQGKAKYGLGRDQEGLSLLERIIDEFPASAEYPEALWYLGIYYESGGDSLHAVEYFQLLADNFQNFKNIDGALYFLAAHELSSGNSRKAMSYLKRIYQSHRNGTYWSHAAWMLAYEAYKKKQYSQSEIYVKEILRHPPDLAVLDRTLYLQGELSLVRSDYSSAFLAFREVGSLCPESPLCFYAARNAQVAASKTVKIN